MLRDLEGQDFEDEVCAFLQDCVSDFQTVPAYPHGDAGLDGHSHHQTVAYCCYGPEAASKENAAKLKAAVVKKFRGDLRTLFELEANGAGKKEKLVHCETAEMKTILASGKKLKTIRLIVSVFETHQLLAPLNEALDAYIAASKCRYVDKKAELTLWGPKQLATKGAVTDLVISRLEHREMLRRVTAAIKSGPVALPASSEFDAKIDWIEAQKKMSKQAVARMKASFRKRWSTAIAVENDLANNAPNLHSLLSDARDEAANDADLVSGTTSSPQELILLMRERIAQRLDEHLGVKFPPEIKNPLIDGELARLIGECPVDWRPDGGNG